MRVGEQFSRSFYLLKYTPTALTSCYSFAIGWIEDEVLKRCITSSHVKSHLSCLNNTLKSLNHLIHFPDKLCLSFVFVVSVSELG